MQGLPLGQAAWDRLAAHVISVSPLAGTDWDAHERAVDADIKRELAYLHKRTARPTPAPGLVCDFAEEPPLSPEEEEQAAAAFSTPQPQQQDAATLF